MQNWTQARGATGDAARRRAALLFAEIEGAGIHV